MKVIQRRVLVTTVTVKKATATCYELVGLGIESRWMRHFPHSPDRPWDRPILLYNWYRVFLEGKAAVA